MTASALPGYFQVTDPAANWPSDPANPGSKLRPWYRVTRCLNATDCTAGNVTSAAAQPVDWFHMAAFEAPAVGSAVLVSSRGAGFRDTGIATWSVSRGTLPHVCLVEVLPGVLAAAGVQCASLLPSYRACMCQLCLAHLSCLAWAACCYTGGPRNPSCPLS